MHSLHRDAARDTQTNQNFDSAMVTLTFINCYVHLNLLCFQYFEPHDIVCPNYCAGSAQ